MCVNSIIHRVHNQFKADAAEKKISLSFRAPADDVSTVILTDGYKLTRVLASLVDNAIKFTKKGMVEFGFEEKKGMFEFYVIDTGIGIPEEQHREVFTRFYQADSSTKRKYEGVGLGLSLSKAYVELLGGTIWFTSHQDEGSEFRFTVVAEKSGE